MISKDFISTPISSKKANITAPYALLNITFCINNNNHVLLIVLSVYKYYPLNAGVHITNIAVPVSHTNIAVPFAPMIIYEDINYAQELSGKYSSHISVVVIPCSISHTGS